MLARFVATTTKNSSKVDDLRHPCILRSFTEGECHLLFNLIKSWSSTNRVQEIEGGVNSFKCAVDFIKIGGISNCDLYSRIPRLSNNLCHISH